MIWGVGEEGGGGGENILSIFGTSSKCQELKKERSNC